jgi:alkylation response protein AidB-like acyl-CoA dehydrogenase
LGEETVDASLTTQEREIVEKAAWVSRECLEPRAAQYDESASYPWESWHDLWEHGLLAAAVPEAYGGLGLDMLTYVMVIERLARGCTSTAMTMHMHSVVQRYIDALATHEQKARLYPDVVERGKLFGSWGSEPTSRGGAGVHETVISPVDGGYVIDGRKHFCTMAGAAHRYMVHCVMGGYDNLDGTTMALVPNDAPGITIAGEWDTLGMRATVSPAVSFESCPVSRDDVLGGPGDGVRHAIGQGFGVGYAAVYLGAAQRALDFTVDYVKTHRFAPDNTPLAESLIVQRAVAEMTMAVDGARLALYRSAEGWEEAGPAERWSRAARAKYPATQAALMVTSRAMQTVGGRSAHKGYPLERLFRDVRTSSLMPPNVDRSLEIVGRAELGIEDEIINPRGSSTD